ncbi:MAG TPA: hypothetical protein VMH78_08030 [Thermoplasmata archaeon]|nr:hypothetical protein [Thermoplasmata archaeon]
MWTQVATPEHPSAREGMGLAYDGADGYVVLFGGLAGQYKTDLQMADVCLNDTWTYRAGVWTNLSIAGPPPACTPAMAYDPADGRVIEYGGIQTLAQNTYALSTNNETWTFVHGRWTNLSALANPWVDTFSMMTYDPDLGAIVLFGLHYQKSSGGTVTPEGLTWEFLDGGWERIPTDEDPLQWSDVYLNGLTFDQADGYLLLLVDNKTWAFIGGDWALVGLVPDDLIGPLGLSFDPKMNETVLFGAEAFYLPHPANENYTWTYVDGAWWNASVDGPPYRSGNGMVFDAYDGYTLTFGGAGKGEVNNLTSLLLADTWIYSPPPTVLNVSTTAVPARVCSRTSLDCGVGTDVTRVTVTVTGEEANANLSSGTDSGKGWVAWGPYYWVPQPTVNFLGWQELVPAPNLAPTATCGLADTTEGSCRPSPSVVSLSGMPGQELVSWSWNGLARYTSFGVGDAWTISFNVEAMGPPYGLVPVDACTTEACGRAGSGMVQGLLSGVVFSPYGNGSRENLSAPLEEVTVVPSPTEGGSTPASSPPPSPPGISTPLPVATPASPVPVSAPSTAPVLTGTAGGISLTALAAGILSAGITTGVRGRLTHRAGVAVRLAKRRSADADRIRGTD